MLVAVLVVAMMDVLVHVQVVLGAWLAMDIAIVAQYVLDVLVECHVILLAMKILVLAVALQNAMAYANTVWLDAMIVMMYTVGVIYLLVVAAAKLAMDTHVKDLNNH